MNWDAACRTSIGHLEALSGSCGAQFRQIDVALGSLDRISPPSNHPLNYVLPLLYGTTGALISSWDAANKFLADIHDAKAKEGGIIEFLLGHERDNIDTIIPAGRTRRVYVDRIRQGILKEGEKDISLGIHRLMWGHDIFSIGPDNPFALLIDQYGVLKGIAQVFRHLIADTFSAQGLPIPFHSYFDYVKADGSVTNRLLDFASSASEFARSNGHQVTKYDAFNRMFTIKAADVGTTGLTWAMCAAHNRIMNDGDEAAAAQVKAIAFSAQFFGKAAIGMMKSGIPFISWPTAMMTIKEIYSLYRLNYRDIAALERRTEQLCAENARLEAEIFASGRDLVSHTRASGYVHELAEFDSRMRALEDFFDR